MKRGLCALAAVLLLGLCAPGAAQADLTVYVSAEAMPLETARQLAALLEREAAPAEVELIAEQETDDTLRALVLRDEAPLLAICPPEEARLYAKEGMLAVPDVPDGARMAQQVLSACEQDGELFMIPLLAHHRQMAVNRRRLEQEHLSDLLDARTHPVWYPLELQQALEALYDGDTPAMELWPPEPDTCAGLEALVQALFGGAFLSEDGQVCQADCGSAAAALEWLRDMLEGGQIGWAQSREEALEHFLTGETAVFIDWMDADERENRARIRESGLELCTLPYPSSTGMPVHSFEVIGAVVLLTGDAQTDALAKAAAAFLAQDAQVQQILGERGIEEDGAVWLPAVGAHPQGTLLSTLLCDALRGTLMEGRSAASALRGVTQALDAAR